MLLLALLLRSSRSLCSCPSMAGAREGFLAGEPADGGVCGSYVESGWNGRDMACRRVLTRAWRVWPKLPVPLSPNEVNECI